MHLLAALQADRQGAPPGEQLPLDAAGWAALFDDPSASSQPAGPEVQDSGAQTEECGSWHGQQQPEAWVDPALVEAAQLEVQQLQAVNADLLDAQLRGEWDAVRCRTRGVG